MGAASDARENVVLFPVVDVCVACGRPTSTHAVNGAWVGCAQDAAVQPGTVGKWLRVAALRPRMLKTQPWLVDVEVES